MSDHCKVQYGSVFLFKLVLDFYSHLAFISLVAVNYLFLEATIYCNYEKIQMVCRHASSVKVSHVVTLSSNFKTDLYKICCPVETFVLGKGNIYP